MNWSEFVYMRQNRADSIGFGLKAVETQQWVQPNKTLGGAPEPGNLHIQQITIIAVQTVGDQQHMRILRQNTA